MTVSVHAEEFDAAEVVVPDTPEERRDVIRRRLDAVAPVIIAAFEARDWEHFGYESWGDYVSGEFGQLRLPRGERSEAVVELRSAGMSQRAIGDALGVNEATVNRDLAGVANATATESVQGLDGKQYPPTRPHVSHNSGRNEWYTPPEYLEAARRVMGHIDLDPASSVKANELVQADTFFTAEQDGLRQSWSGRVWMNPPYSSDLIWPFCEKLCTEVADGKVLQAIALVNNATETAWFQRMLEIAAAVCFPARRVQFLDTDMKPGAPLQGQAAVYFGTTATQTERFARVFNDFGTVVQPI